MTPPRFDVDTATPREMALFLADMGIPVGPLNYPRGKNELGDVGCSCGNNRLPKNDDEPDLCEKQGKHPSTDHGFHDATTDLQQIDEWWTAAPNSNLGLPAGERSGILVVDLDPRNRAPSDRDVFQSKYGLIPNGTPEILSGGGGLHLWFAYDPVALARALRLPPGAKPSGKLELGPGIEVLYNSYAIVPPSLHRCGNRYRFDGENPLGSLPVLLSTPDWVYRHVHKVTDNSGAFHANNGNGNGNGNGHSVRKWEKGERDSGLASFTGKLQRDGYVTPEDLRDHLLIANRSCIPPLPPKDIARIARSVSRYKPAPDDEAEVNRPLTDV